MKKLYRLPEGFKFGSSASAWDGQGKKNINVILSI